MNASVNTQTRGWAGAALAAAHSRPIHAANNRQRWPCAGWLPCRTGWLHCYPSGVLGEGCQRGGQVVVALVCRESSRMTWMTSSWCPRWQPSPAVSNFV